MGSDPVAVNKRIYNVNVGVLGHVDSGKTSLGNREVACTSRALCSRLQALLLHLLQWQPYQRPCQQQL